MTPQTISYPQLLVIGFQTQCINVVIHFCNIHCFTTDLHCPKCDLRNNLIDIKHLSQRSTIFHDAGLWIDWMLQILKIFYHVNRNILLFWNYYMFLKMYPNAINLKAGLMLFSNFLRFQMFNLWSMILLHWKLALLVLNLCPRISNSFTNPHTFIYN